MNKSLKTRLCLTLMLLMLLTPLMAYAERVVKVGLYDFKPLIFKDDKGEPAGLFVDVLNHVARKEGWQVNYVYRNWKETYQALLDGELDLVPCIGITDDRKKRVDFSSDYLFLDWGVIYSRPGSGIESIHDLKNKRVAVLSASVYTDGLKQTLQQFDITPKYIENKNFTEIFRAIEEKKVDAGISTNLTGIQFEKEFSARRTQILFSPVKIAYAVKKETNSDLLKVLDREVAALKADKGSLFYNRYDYWITNLSGGKIPGYVWWFTAGLLSFGLFLIFWNRVLKSQVDAKTGYLEVEIAKRKQNEEKLLDKNAELERFAYTISHDLKSPIITIKGFTGSMEQDLMRGKFDRLAGDLGRIRAAADNMNDLLSDLLDLSRIGRIINTPELVDMNELVEGVVSQLYGLLNENLVKIEVQPALSMVLCDRQRVAEVVQNLLENAIKYRGDQAEPRIVIGLRKEQGNAVFFVQDNGIGIDEKYHENIFGLFNQLNASSDGTGIGLALVKSIVEVHGGRVWVESEGLNKGSTFCFTLAQ